MSLCCLVRLKNITTCALTPTNQKFCVCYKWHQCNISSWSKWVCIKDLLKQLMAPDYFQWFSVWLNDWTADDNVCRYVLCLSFHFCVFLNDNLDYVSAHNKRLFNKSKPKAKTLYRKTRNIFHTSIGIRRLKSSQLLLLNAFD